MATRGTNAERATHRMEPVGKVALAFGMVALALMNRYAIVPRLRARGAAAIADLRRLTIAELGLAAGVLALVSLFGLLDPL